MEITIILNGKPHPLPAEMSLAGLIDSLGLAGKPIVVELDGEAILPREVSERKISDGAKVEIVTLAAGG